jgi:hypothetical protein
MTFNDNYMNFSIGKYLENEAHRFNCKMDKLEQTLQ